MLAMVVNDNACLLFKRGALKTIASELLQDGTAYSHHSHPHVNPVTIRPLFDFPKEPSCQGLNCLPPPSASLPSG
jgi:hypothetical protein